jgi:hypothetical protein
MLARAMVGKAALAENGRRQGSAAVVAGKHEAVRKLAPPAACRQPARSSTTSEIELLHHP